jgi:hypothetical protein
VCARADLPIWRGLAVARPHLLPIESNSHGGVHFLDETITFDTKSLRPTMIAPRQLRLMGFVLKHNTVLAWKSNRKTYLLRQFVMLGAALIGNPARCS